MNEKVTLLGLGEDEYIGNYGSILGGRHAMLYTDNNKEGGFSRFRIIDPLHWILVARHEVMSFDTVFIDESKSGWWYMLSFDHVNGLAVRSSLGRGWGPPITISKFHHGTMNGFLWDHRLSKYVIYRRDWTRVDNEILRLVTRVEIDRFSSVIYEDNQRGGERNEYPKQFFDASEGYLPDIPNADFYTFPVVQVRHDLYIATPTVFIHNNNELPHTGTMEIWILTSADGISWQKAVVPYGSAKQIYALNGYGFGKVLYYIKRESEHAERVGWKSGELYCDTLQEYV